MKIKTLFLIFLLLTVNLSATAYSDHRNRRTDSLENVLRKAPPKDKIERLKIYSDLAWGYLETNEQKSTYYADLGIALAQEMQGYYKLADLYRIKGMHHWGNARYEQSKVCFDKSLEALELMRKSRKYDEEAIDDTESAIYGSMGNLYNTWGNGAKAINYYFKAVKLFQKHDWKESESIAYKNMAELYCGMGNLKRAEIYYHKAVGVARQTHDSLMISGSYEGLAKLYRLRKQYDKAEKLMTHVYQYVFSHPDEGSSRSNCLINLADIYLDKGDLVKAEKIIRQHETLNREFHRSEAPFDCQKAQLAMLKGDWTKTKELAERALKIDNQAPEIEMEASRLLARAYTHLGDPAKAVKMMDKADSLFAKQANYAYQSSLTEQEVRFDTERKDLKIESLANARVTYLMLFLSTILLLILVIALFIYRRKANERQKELLTDRLIMETEVKERQILGKDLHDGLGGTLSLLKLKIRDQVSGEALQILDKSIDDLRRISHHIMPEELITHGLEASLRDFAAAVPGAQFHFFGERNPLKQDVELVLYRCAYELVNNAIKHAEATRIDIQLMQDSRNIILTVSDNGKGFDTSQETKGMGLQNIRNRITRYKGKMEIISHQGDGTEINVTLPL